MPAKKAILVTSFGTSYPDTCTRNITAIEEAIARAYPDYDVRRAFTSGMIIRKLKRRDGVLALTVKEALAQLAAEGFSRVILQPTHILNGLEFGDIVAAATPYAASLSLKIANPLLTDPADYRELAAILSGAFPAQEGNALCLMGHGTNHFSDAAYAALEYWFRDLGRRDIHVATVEGFPDLAALRRRLAEGGYGSVTLTPLMVVAGDHAAHDMAGNGEDSWKTVLEADGCRVLCVLKGLGEYQAVREMYVRHVREAMERETTK